MRFTGVIVLAVSLALSACGTLQKTTATPNTNEPTLEMETLTTIPTLAPLAGPCASPEPDMLNEITARSITAADSGKTLILHTATRFSIYLDDRIYSLAELEKSVPTDLLGYISNGSIRGPQCYPIMYESLKQGKGMIQVKDFTLNIVVDDHLTPSTLPLH